MPGGYNFNVLFKHVETVFFKKFRLVLAVKVGNTQYGEKEKMSDYSALHFSACIVLVRHVETW
jgi:hypothetical protein